MGEDRMIRAEISAKVNKPSKFNTIRLASKKETTIRPATSEN